MLTFDDVPRPEVKRGPYKKVAPKNLRVVMQFPRGSYVTVEGWSGIWRVYGPHPDYGTTGEGYDYYLEPIDESARIVALMCKYGMLESIATDMSVYQPN